MAASRAFGNGIEGIGFDMTKARGHAIMRSSPVHYVKSAAPRGSVFEQNVYDGSICAAFTDFWVDHKEPMDALKNMRDNSIHWPLGELPDGCEFLVLAEAAVSEECAVNSL